MLSARFFATFAGAFAIAALATGISTLPQRKSYLSPYQDAWKTFLQDSVFVLYQRSYEHDPLVGWNGRCFHGRNYEWNTEEKYVVAETYYWDDAAKKIVNKTLYTTPEATEGYTVPNAMTVSPYKDKLVSVYYPFVVSEYRNCDILRSPGSNNGCQMWVTLDGLHNISSACFFIYDLLCGPNKFQKYNEEFCRDKIQIK
ncbi:uncharacterized protein LOC144123252 isoform X2 [Amblyomma americanum]